MIELKIVAEDYNHLKQEVKNLYEEIHGVIISDEWLPKVEVPFAGHLVNEEVIAPAPVEEAPQVIEAEDAIEVSPEVEELVVAKPKVKKGKAPKSTKSVVDEAPVIPETPPINFISESEFIKGFAKILTQLITSKVIDQSWVNDAAKELGVSFIYQAASDPAKLISLYSKLLGEGKLIKKGDY
jgi:hypothetical protein